MTPPNPLSRPAPGLPFPSRITHHADFATHTHVVCDIPTRRDSLTHSLTHSLTPSPSRITHHGSRSRLTHQARGLPLLLLLLAAAVLLAGCSRQGKDQPAAATAEKKSEPESRIKHAANGEVIVTLDTETQKAMGLQTAAAVPARLSPEVKGYGRVLDPSPLATLVAELTTDQAASEASQAELKRLKTLAVETNASERAVQTAEAAAARDQAQVESARLRLLANWGSAIAGRPDLPAFVQSLSSLSGAVVQLDLPAGEPLTAAPTGARLLTLTDGAKAIDAQYLSPAPMVDPQLQGRGFLFLVTPNPLRLAPGAAVSGFLSLPGEAQTGVAVPRNAIVRFNGATWVYLQTGQDTFQRREVALGSPLEDGWFLREGLKPEDKVVTAGAQQLLSEELKGQGGE